MKGTLDKQIKQHGYNHNSIVRPRPEEKYLNKGYDFSSQLSGIEPGIKRLAFEKLYCANENWPKLFNSENQFIANDMRRYTNGEFSKLKDEALCLYIQEWKGINLTEGGKLNDR